MNTNVLNGLNVVDKVTDIYAYLVDDKGTQVAGFLFNPESKRYNRKANYTEAAVATTSLPSQYYNYTSGLTLDLPNLLLETYTEGKTCDLILQRIQDLMVADPAAGKYNPTPVYFVWGADKFGPAVITTLDWEETSWLNGKVASARVNITLLEVPKGANSASSPAPQPTSSSNNVITDRQKEDASTKAKTWLKANVAKLKDNINPLVKSNSYLLSTDSKGVVTIFDKSKKVLGIVGTLVGSEFKTDKNTVTK